MIPYILHTIVGYIHANKEILSEYKSEAQTFYKDGHVTYICVYGIPYNHRSIEIIDGSYYKNCIFKSVSSYNISRKFQNGKFINKDLVPRNYYLDNIHNICPHSIHTQHAGNNDDDDSDDDMIYM